MVRVVRLERLVLPHVAGAANEGHRREGAGRYVCGCGGVTTHSGAGVGRRGGDSTSPAVATTGGLGDLRLRRFDALLCLHHAGECLQVHHADLVLEPLRQHRLLLQVQAALGAHPGDLVHVRGEHRRLARRSIRRASLPAHQREAQQARQPVGVDVARGGLELHHRPHLLVRQRHVRGTRRQQLRHRAVLAVQHAQRDQVERRRERPRLQERAGGVQRVQVEPRLHRGHPLRAAHQLQLCAERRVQDGGPLQLHVGHEEELLVVLVLQHDRLRDALQLLAQRLAALVAHEQAGVLHGIQAHHAVGVDLRHEVGLQPRELDQGHLAVLADLAAAAAPHKDVRRVVQPHGPVAQPPQHRRPRRVDHVQQQQLLALHGDGAGLGRGRAAPRGALQVRQRSPAHQRMPAGSSGANVACTAGRGRLAPAVQRERHLDVGRLAAGDGVARQLRGRPLPELIRLQQRVGQEAVQEPGGDERLRATLVQHLVAAAGDDEAGERREAELRRVVAALEVVHRAVELAGRVAALAPA